MADAMILSRETCLNAVQKRKFQTTSKKVVRLNFKIDRGIDFADLFVYGSFSIMIREASSFFLHIYHLIDLLENQTAIQFLLLLYLI